MTLENARVLYKHRLELGKSVDDILNLYPELAEPKKVEEPQKVEAPKIEEKQEVKHNGKKSTR